MQATLVVKLRASGFDFSIHDLVFQRGQGLQYFKGEVERNFAKLGVWICRVWAASGLKFKGSGLVRG